MTRQAGVRKNERVPVDSLKSGQSSALARGTPARIAGYIRGYCVHSMITEAWQERVKRAVKRAACVALGRTGWTVRARAKQFAVSFDRGTQRLFKNGPDS